MCGTPTEEDCPGITKLPHFKSVGNVLYQRRLKEFLKPCPDEVIDIIGKLLSWNPQARMTAQEALMHPFFGHPVDHAPVHVKLDSLHEYELQQRHKRRTSVVPTEDRDRKRTRIEPTKSEEKVAEFKPSQIPKKVISNEVKAPTEFAKRDHHTPKSDHNLKQKEDAEKKLSKTPSPDVGSDFTTE